MAGLQRAELERQIKDLKGELANAQLKFEGEHHQRRVVADELAQVKVRTPTRKALHVRCVTMCDVGGLCVPRRAPGPAFDHLRAAGDRVGGAQGRLGCEDAVGGRREGDCHRDRGAAQSTGRRPAPCPGDSGVDFEGHAGP